MSTAISRVFGTALSGRADDHQTLSDTPIDLSATITMLPCRGEQEKLKMVFEPLGYSVSYETFIADEKFIDWGESKYVNLTISGKVRLRDLLKHLFVLIPVFDRQKHYWVGSDEVEKLLRHGEDWLPDHPEKAYITGRYLNRRRSLVNMAYAKLAEADPPTDTPPDATQPDEEERQNLNTQRLGTVIAALKSRGVKRVIDIGCGEGQLLSQLVKERQFTNITGVDVSHVAIERANKKLKLERAGDYTRERVQLFQGSLTYKDARFEGYDAACVIEVIEHLDIPRLNAFERVLFEFAKPPLIVLTTPNREYNERYEFLDENSLRHGDHRFEYTRDEFRKWAIFVADKFDYTVQFSEIGEFVANLGAPTQMCTFTLKETASDESPETPETKEVSKK